MNETIIQDPGWRYVLERAEIYIALIDRDGVGHRAPAYASGIPVVCYDCAVCPGGLCRDCGSPWGEAGHYMPEC